MAGVPPRDPRDPSEDETVVADDWGPETVVVEEAETPPPRRPRLGLWPWLLALLLLVLGGLGVAYALSRDDEDGAATTATQATSAEERLVPDVVGTTSSEATATLREAGFEANVVAVPSDRSPGTVVAQDPTAGSEAPEGTRVRLNVAEERAETTTATTGTTTETRAATAPATMPDVQGQELADAGRALAAEWLHAAVRYVPSGEAAGRVVAQARPAGTVLKRGDSVQLNVSTGADPAEATAVPEATGQQLDRSRSVLEESGFEVLALRRGPGEVRNEDEVVSQSPAAGASIPRGSLVLLYVA